MSIFFAALPADGLADAGPGFDLDAPEVLLELGPGHLNEDGPAVGTVAHVPVGQHIFDELLLLGGRGVVPRFDRGAAGHVLVHPVELLRGRVVFVEQPSRHFREELGDVLFDEHGGDFPHRDQTGAEVGDIEARLFQKLRVLQDGGVLLLRQRHSDRHEQHLGLHRFLVGDEPVVEDALMGGMLVDQEHLPFQFHEDIGLEGLPDDAEVRHLVLFREGHDGQVLLHRQCRLFRFRFFRRRFVRAVRLPDIRHGTGCGLCLLFPHLGFEALHRGLRFGRQGVFGGFRCIARRKDGGMGLLLFGGTAPLPLPLFGKLFGPETLYLFGEFGFLPQLHLVSGRLFEGAFAGGLLTGQGQTVRGVFGGDGVPGGVVDRVEHRAFVGKAHLGLGGMHVHVHHFEGQFDIQDTGRELADHDGVFVGALQGSRRSHALHEPAVQEEELHGAVRTAGRGLRDEAGDFHAVQFIGCLEQGFRKVLAEDGVDGGLEVPVAGGDQHLLVVPDEPDGYLRMGQGDAVHDACNTVALRHVLFQELHAGRSVVEQVPDHDGGAFGAAGIGQKDFLGPFDFIKGADLVLRRAGHDVHAGDRGNGGQGLSPEPEGPDAVEVFLGEYFAGGVAHEGVADVFPQNAGAVVGHPHEGDAAVLDFHRQRSGTGVNGVLHEFLDDG